jgi:hypothetical protein
VNPTLALLVLQPFLSQSAQPDEAKTRIYFMVFEASTLYAMTEQTIEGAFDLTSLLRKTVPTLKSLLERRDSTPATISGNYIRLKLVDREGVWLVDQRGCISHNGASYKLSRDRFYELKDFFVANIPRPPEPKHDDRRP